jgi:hypothetical protein
MAEITAFKVINQYLLSDISRLIETDTSFRILMHLEIVNANCLTHLINYYKETFAFSDVQAVLLVKYHVITNTIPFVPQAKLYQFLALSTDISTDVTYATACSTLVVSTIASSSDISSQMSPVATATLATTQSTALTMGDGLITYTNGVFPFLCSINFNDLHNIVSTGITDVLTEELDVPSEELPNFQRNTSISGRDIAVTSASSAISELSLSPLRRRR